MGRKSRATPEMLAKIVKDLEDVYYIKIAAHLNSISPTTVGNWISDGEKHAKVNHPDDSECDSTCDEELVAKRRFSVNVKESQAKFTQSSLKQITKHSKKNWQAAAWQLERTQPNEFGMKQRVEHTGDGGGPIIHKVLSPERRKAIAEAALNRPKLINTRLENNVYVPDED